MLNCYGCKNRNTYKCGECVGWNKYESNTLINPVLAMDINREMRMLHKAALNGLFGFKNAERKIDMKIKKVIFNAPTTVVLWEDGTKTIVKAGEGDIYDPEKGLAMAIAKKALGNQGNYYEVFKKWLPDGDEFKELPELLKKLIDKKTIKSEFIHDDNGIKLTVTNTPPQIQLLSTKEVAEANNMSMECVRKQIKDGFIRSAEKINGKWKIPCYVFDDHVEVFCM